MFTIYARLNNHVNEHFLVASGSRYAAGRWLINLEHALFRDGFRFFHRNIGLFSIENARDIVIRTRTGLRFPLMKALNATFEVDVDWDGDPPPDTKRTDTRTSMNLGYRW